MIRSAALEIDFLLLSMICIDTHPILTTKDALIQATQELIMPYWKSRMRTSEDGSDNTEKEVCYHGKNRYVRQLYRSRSDIMGDTELPMKTPIGIAIITGGLGGLGLVTAETIVDMGQRMWLLVNQLSNQKNLCCWK